MHGILGGGGQYLWFGGRQVSKVLKVQLRVQMRKVGMEAVLSSDQHGLWEEETQGWGIKVIIGGFWVMRLGG